MTSEMTPLEIRLALLLGREIALIDVRQEAEFALGHPLFASQIPLDRLEIEAPFRLPRRTCPIVIYDNGEGLAKAALTILDGLGYSNVHQLAGGLSGWRDAGLEIFIDVNSYCKAFGELVEHRRHTPSLAAEEVKALLDRKADMAILDARRFDEYQVMAIPGGISVPGAELVLHARSIAPDPATPIIVNCAGRTRSLLGAQSLINAGIPNPVHALRNGTIGWTLAGQELAHGQSARPGPIGEHNLALAQSDAREVAYRAGVREISEASLGALLRDDARTLYCFDVRTEAEYAAGHIRGFLNVPGGQLIQETDMVAPARGARIVLADDLGVRAWMTASWLRQMNWDVQVIVARNRAWDATDKEGPPRRGAEGGYKRPYEGTDNGRSAMQAYLDWEYGLVEQLARDASHGFFVI